MKKTKKKKINTINPIIPVILLMLSLILLLPYLFKENKKQFNINEIIEDKNYGIIYELYNEFTTYPVINVLSDDITRINKEIEELYSYSTLEYDYNVSVDTLSIIFKEKTEIENKQYISYKTYTIDLNTKQELTDEEILNKFDIDKQTLSLFVRSKFENYYSNLLKRNIINKNECDYDCFIENCNFQDYLEDNNYYIENNHLILYKFFNNYNNYFNEENYRFEVK